MGTKHQTFALLHRSSKRFARGSSRSLQLSQSLQRIGVGSLVAAGREIRPDTDEPAADDYVKVTSLKSIETISMSVMGLRSGPRV